MTNRVHQSEIALAEHAIERVDDPQHVLVGGPALCRRASAPVPYSEVLYDLSS